MAGIDMTTRILKLYEALNRGRKIFKEPFCMEYEISERTFDRDIEKIRLFLSEEYSGKEVEYSSREECYSIPGIEEQGSLSMLELMIIVKMLKSEAGLESQEFEGLVKTLLSVADHSQKEKIKKSVDEEIGQYENRSGQKAFLKLFGDLQKCIEDRNVIWLDLGEHKVLFFPVALEYLSPEFYLLGYEPREETVLCAYCLNKVEAFQISLRKYGEEIVEQYRYWEGRSLLENIRKKGDTEDGKKN